MPSRSPSREPEEDEFENRDAQGLMPRKKDGPGSDAEAAAKAQSMYMGLFFMKIPLIQLALSTGTYATVCYGLPILGMAGMKAAIDEKLALIAAHDLAWVYLAVYIVSLGRDRIALNANASRAGARVDRPDQHVYKIMSPEAKASSPYVLMSNTGWTGRFNRAQRGAFNTDEAMPLFLANLLLAGAVFGPVVVALAALAVYGRVTFALLYTEGTGKRGAGFLPAIVGERWIGGLVLFTAIKVLAADRIPY